jgi:hypothetical protein
VLSLLSLGRGQGEWFLNTQIYLKTRDGERPWCRVFQTITQPRGVDD